MARVNPAPEEEKDFLGAELKQAFRILHGVQNVY